MQFGICVWRHGSGVCGAGAGGGAAHALGKNGQWSCAPSQLDAMATEVAPRISDSAGVAHAADRAAAGARGGARELKREPSSSATGGAHALVPTQGTTGVASTAEAERTATSGAMSAATGAASAAEAAGGATAPRARPGRRAPRRVPQAKAPRALRVRPRRAMSGIMSAAREAKATSGATPLQARPSGRVVRGAAAGAASEAKATSGAAGAASGATGACERRRRDR